MLTFIHLHSSIGSTPITKRGGSYCDLLSYIETECNSIGEAKLLCNELLKNVKHAYSVTFNIPSHRNQNLKHDMALAARPFVI